MRLFYIVSLLFCCAIVPTEEQWPIAPKSISQYRITCTRHQTIISKLITTKDGVAIEQTVLYRKNKKIGQTRVNYMSCLVARELYGNIKFPINRGKQ